jgi:alkylation response protein AidB-like acyl-CoA dehydrogenase
VDARLETRVHDSVVNVFASEAPGQVADRVVQPLGGRDYSEGRQVERPYQDSRMRRMVEDPKEVHRNA